MTRQPMKREDMVISEEWRWRLLAIWVIVFTAIAAYSLIKVHVISDENRDALCSIHSDRVSLYSSLSFVADKEGQEDVAKILASATEDEEAALSELECG